MFIPKSRLSDSYLYKNTIKPNKHVGLVAENENKQANLLILLTCTYICNKSTSYILIINNHGKNIRNIHVHEKTKSFYIDLFHLLKSSKDI